jgi:selenocysteine-specific elongation factor
VLEGRGKTVGGGRVLAVAAPKRRRGRPDVLRQLEVLARGDADARVGAVLEMAGPAGLDVAALVGRTALSPKAVAAALERLGAKGGAVLFDRERRAWAAGPIAAELSARLLRAVDAFHAGKPLAAGIGREELRGRLPPIVDPRLYQRLVAQLADRGELVVEGDRVRRRGHAAAPAGEAGGRQKDRLAEVLAKGGLTPPWLAELPAAIGASATDVQALLKLLAAEGRAVRVSAELWFDAAALAGLRERLVVFLRERKAITTQEFKDLVGATRKHVIPLAEHFDEEKVTLRVGEKRVLRGEGKA